MTGIKIDPEAMYTEHSLRVFGIDEESLATGRKKDGLPCRDVGSGVRLYLGSELLEWFERRRVPEREKAS